MAPKFSEIPPLFKADRRTVLAFEPKDGKIIVNYANWGENTVALEGQDATLRPVIDSTGIYPYRTGP